MKVLVSPVSLQEAELVAAAGADILDIKNTKEGSLGAQFPWVIQSIVDRFRDTGIVCSATLGDLPFKPGTAALAAFGAAKCGVRYIKAGLFGVDAYPEAVELMSSIVRAIRLADPAIITVASGYADYKRFGGLPWHVLPAVAKDSGAHAVMLDTYVKDGKTLFDALTVDELAEFTRTAHVAGLKVALAGSIMEKHFDKLMQIQPDIIGIRGAACSDQERTNGIDLKKLTEFLYAARTIFTKTTSLN